MKNARIKISSIVENQVPLFVREDFPLVTEFLKEYYRSIDREGSYLDILQNIDQYIKVDNNHGIIESTSLESDVNYFDSTIKVSSTEGFPNNYGLVKIDNEIILYKRKTNTTFEDCIRGFNGVSSFDQGKSEELTFLETESAQHLQGAVAENLSLIFLSVFFKKIKKQFLPGFEDRTLSEGLNKNLFLKSSKDFYSSKGTEESFKILFKVLFGTNVSLIRPSDLLIEPSKATYKVDRIFVVEPISGNIEDLKNRTIFQDEVSFIPSAFGSVNNVEKIYRNDKEYYQLSVDYDFDKDINVSGSIFGSFSIHPRTRLVESVAQNQNYIIVDSTIGFPDSGELSLPGIAGEVLVTYAEKTHNQFLGCSGITESFSSTTIASLNAFAYAYSSDSSLIKFRVTGVLARSNLTGLGKYSYADDVVTIASLGYSNLNEFTLNNWIFNISVNCQVKTFTDIGNLNYEVETYDNNNVFNGDFVEVDYISGLTNERTSSIFVAKVADGSVPGKSFKITSPVVILNIFSIRKVVSTFKDTQYTTDVQNTYKDFRDNSIYITSSSLPNYTNSSVTIQDFKLSLSGGYSGDTFSFTNHGYLTGDSIVYSCSPDDNIGITSGVYFVKKIDDNLFKISRSRSDIFLDKYISIASTSVTQNYFFPLKFADRLLSLKGVSSQRLVRNLKSPKYDNKVHETHPGPVGILANGVELLSYKSNDYVHYGSIESVEVLSPGEGYDIINLPTLTVSESFPGEQKPEVYLGVEGSLSKINVIDGGFNYDGVPEIIISGGSGSGAIAKANLIEVDYFIDFNSTSTNSNLDISLDLVGFSTSHKFKNGDFVKYSTSGERSLSGLSTNSNYYVSVYDDYKIRLHKTRDDSLSQKNHISISDYGYGVHTLTSIDKKRKIGSISIINSGSGYKNKKISLNSTGINTYKNSIEVYNHPYQSGEIIQYSNITGSSPTGLSTGSYYVTRISDTEFKLSPIGSGITDSDFYYKNREYLDFKDYGSGEHVFNYENISVRIIGNTGISSSQERIVDATIEPLFKGIINYAYVKSGGVGYGSSEIINYDKQPNYEINVGRRAQIKTLISSGKIVSVIILDSGENYYSIPEIKVNGDGYGAILSPIISNGRIIDVRIISSGTGYLQETTSIDVLSSGSGCQLKFNPKKWTINIFERLLRNNKLSDDDGVLYPGTNTNYGLQYSHIYPSRNLRKKVFTSTEQDGIENYRSDYDNDFELEKYHSPILGWSYDGNPIYGPYGYVSSNNKKIKRMVSGYSDPRDDIEYRPNKNLFPAGFFVEDYTFGGNGDLDENNGRFVITPEFPNGVYAYFTTISDITYEGTTFDGEKIPVFPYAIGNNYKASPNEFNFKITSNQNNFDIRGGDILRNTKNYNLLSNNSDYSFITNPIKDIRRNPRVTQSTDGPVDNIRIISKGDNYKVSDVVIFDNSLVNGFGAKANISRIEGKKLEQISYQELNLNNVLFYPSTTNKLIGFCTIPHTLKNNDIIKIESFSDENSKLSGNYSVGIRTEYLVSYTSIGDTSVTGLVTYFDVLGSLRYPNIIIDDIFSIGNEKVKVLDIDEQNSRIKVLRSYSGTLSTSHTAPFQLSENSRKLTFTPSIKINPKDFTLNKKIYFNPRESLGIGSSVTGIGTQIYFSNPGAGITSINIPQKTIYLKNHGFENNTPLVYFSNGNPISVSTDGSSSFNLQENSTIYASKISNDLIGISTVRVSIGTDGQYVGISQTASTLYFVGFGTGLYHSLETNYSIISGNINKNTVSVKTSENHELFDGDFVRMNIISGLTTHYTVEYNDYHRRVIINKRQFDTNSIDLTINAIKIENHNFKSGQKVIYNSSSPSVGLEDNKIYYVVSYNKDYIKLSNSYYNAISENPIVVDITSTSSGFISPINPPIKIVKNQPIVFDLSDESLSIPFGIGRTSSFEFNIWLDSNYNRKYYALDGSNNSIITYTGIIGSSENAKLEIKPNSFTPEELYYSLDPLISDENLDIKKQKIIDTEVPNNNKILLGESKYSGNYRITGIGLSTFEYSIGEQPETNLYTTSNIGISSYTTNSKNATGSISEIKISSGGKFDSIPGITTVVSESGFGALLVPDSNKIGKIDDSEILDIGFDYPIDETLKPYITVPLLLRIEPLSNFESITITSPGLNYSTSPSLIAIDSVSNKLITDLILDFNIETSEVKIIKNTQGIYDVTPRLIPINNTNGIKIENIEYSGGEVVVTLNKQFSNIEDFPFSVGEKVLIEGVSVVETRAKGYNSKNYDYTFFEIREIDPNIGGSNSIVKYSIVDYLVGSEFTGTFDSDNSSARIIPANHLPTFDVILSKNLFLIDEPVTSENSTGKIVEVDEINDIIKVETISDFESEKIIIGKYSGSKGLIKDIYSYKSYCDVEDSSVVKTGWTNQFGFMSDSTQRIHDNDYYQYFSYSLKSEVSYEKWNDSATTLNHTLGFKKFSDFELYSSTIEYTGITTSQNEGLFSSTAELNSIVDTYCVYNFDLVFENSLYADSILLSDEIIFNSKIIQDYIESVGNRVLLIDDISGEFNTTQSATFVTSFSI